MFSVGTEMCTQQTSTPLASPVHSDEESVVMEEPYDVSWMPEEEMTIDTSTEEPVPESHPDSKSVQHVAFSVFGRTRQCCIETCQSVTFY